MMKTAALLLAFTAPLASGVVLSKEIMDLVVTAAKLSSLAYEEGAPEDTVTADYSTFGYYDAEPDQALTAKTKDGYCFVAFRGTSLTWDDWKQNLEIGKEDICVEVGGEKEQCCTSRKGFYGAYNTDYRDEVEQDIRECAATCDNMDECVVITGHSQGGAIAAVAGLYLADLNPYIITFGQPATIDAPCPLITSERYYRFINTKETENLGIAYDPIPMAPGLGADQFGQMIVLGPDSTGVAYLGLDAQDFLHPYTVGVEAHFMVNGSTPYSGYEDRLNALMANGEFPIRNNGYVAGSLCSEHKECESNQCDAETHMSWNRCIGTDCQADDECDTDRCDSGTCITKALSCMTCDEDNDCAGDGKCLFFKCSKENGLMDNNCVCLIGSDCDSGRCEGISNPQCEAQLSLGGSCNEHSDCKSSYCSWNFICEDSSKSSATEDGGGGLGGVTWALITVLAAGGIYLTHKFIKQRRAGYDEVPTATIDV
eukprot:CAMPEP_0119008414 /NCGR_PEP_ID=MMETSP1176-20130426/3675_1 /TAXON_ID=265551 /ORGANISM="Synedropsis recta cf, Strain CCMP1620" /LENGTH=483 /DNA_ID=CAMNT_0006960739 /DNA_START=67 /DNA_END=1518 /DNA_ORIENTATION=-